MRLDLALAAVLSLCAAPGVARGQGGAPDTAGVRAVVERYLHGLKFNDTLALRDAFWPEARLYYVARDGSLGEWTQSAWYASFAGSVGREEDGTLRIAALEVTRDIASVKVVEEYPRSRYTDYLSLVRWQGRWRIVNKIYTAERR